MFCELNELEKSFKENKVGSGGENNIDHGQTYVVIGRNRPIMPTPKGIKAMMEDI